jgi:arginase
MNKIAIIGVPSSAGAHHVGQERAPQLFRQTGIVERLLLSQFEVVDLGDLPQVSYRVDPQDPKRQNLDLVSDVAQRVADQVSKAVQVQAKPIVLGGDCTISLGVLSGLIRHFPNLGLIYFDGDIDLHTPADTPSGIFDGMGMAHIIGEGAEELTRLGPRYPLLSQENIILFGYNLDAGWIDAIEVERLQQCSMAQYPVTHIRNKGVNVSKEALERLEDSVEHILVHFDVDVITHEDFPVADVPHYNGLTFSETLDILRVFVSSPKFVGLVITEFNAERDPKGIYAEKLVAAIAEILQKGNRYWIESNVV